MYTELIEFPFINVVPFRLMTDLYQIFYIKRKRRKVELEKS